MKCLRSHGRTLQYERPVPKKVQSIVGKKSWRATLDTDNRSVAQKRCRDRTVATEKEIDAAKNATHQRLREHETYDRAIWAYPYLG